MNPGNVLIIFPEGTRSTSGAVGAFKPGIGLLLAGTKVPVVPCHLAGAFESWPKGAMLPRPRKLRLLIGTARDYSTETPGRGSARRVVEDLHDQVMSLARGS